MTIEEKTTTTYTATTLPGAPSRETRAEAEADEARGVELAAYLAVLPTLTREQWERVATWDMARGKAWNAAQGVAWSAARDVERNAAEDAAWDAARGIASLFSSRFAARDAARAACAIIVRDRITPDQFNTLTTAMREAGVDFDGLTNHMNVEHISDYPEPGEQLCPECRGQITSWFCEPCGNTGKVTGSAERKK